MRSFWHTCKAAALCCLDCQSAGHGKALLHAISLQSCEGVAEGAEPAALAASHILSWTTGSRVSLQAMCSWHPGDSVLSVPDINNCEAWYLYTWTLYE